MIEPTPTDTRDAVLCLATAGVVGADVLDAVEDAISERLGLAVSRRPLLVDPTGAWDPVRGQYGSVAIMRRALAVVPPGAARLLLVTELDIFVPVLSFVFGHAQLDGPVAIMATARLRQAFYGMEADAGLEIMRARIEALHEVGHTFGLTHCLDRACAMSLATTVEHVDRKADDYCSGCGALVREALVRLREPDRLVVGLGGTT
jgi:archaemetzincin